MSVPNRAVAVIDNMRLGMMLFIAAEIMFFSGLIGAYLVFRLGVTTWPPPDQPRLPVLTTAMNTLFLLGSAWTIRLAARTQRREAIRWNIITLILGLVFLIGQGLEWRRLLAYGLTVDIGPYGFTFYMLIGFHALHVIGALIWRTVDVLRTLQNDGRMAGTIESSQMYWSFVVGLWPVLYGLVYLY